MCCGCARIGVWFLCPCVRVCARGWGELVYVCVCGGGGGGLKPHAGVLRFGGWVGILGGFTCAHVGFHCYVGACGLGVVPPLPSLSMMLA